MVTSAQDFLQPALLDRLTDDEPGKRSEAREQRSMSKARLRAAVLRDLAWLFNATQQSDADAWAPYPHAQRSVLNYGLPALSGQTASTVDVGALEAAVRQAIVDHEPRILASTLRFASPASSGRSRCRSICCCRPMSISSPAMSRSRT
jgi:type VI secretion system protein ImpF